MAGHACTPGSWRSYLLRAASAAWGRVRAQTWPILQSTGAATAAWAIAAHLIDHHEPFFAPVAAVVALNTSRGERGLNAVRLLLGVIVGIVVGSLALRIGGGYGALAMATFAAMLIALALGGQRLVIAQAAVGAILTVTIGQDEAGIGRLIDALIGAGVALLISQVLLPAEPIALLRRAEATTLEEIGSGLELTADALDRGDENLAERAIDRLRDVRDQLADLARTRTSSRRAMWGSPLWWGRGAPVLRESENAGHLDLLGGSALMLARTAEETSPPPRGDGSPRAGAGRSAHRPGERARRARHPPARGRAGAGRNPTAPGGQGRRSGVAPHDAGDHPHRRRRHHDLRGGRARPRDAGGERRHRVVARRRSADHPAAALVAGPIPARVRHRGHRSRSGGPCTPAHLLTCPRKTRGGGGRAGRRTCSDRRH